MATKYFRSFGSYSLLTQDSLGRFCVLDLSPSINRMGRLGIRLGVDITFENADYADGGWVVFVEDKRGHLVFDTVLSMPDDTVLGGHSFHDFALPTSCETVAVEIAQAIGMEFEHAIITGDQAGIHDAAYCDLVFKDGSKIEKWSPYFIWDILHGKEFQLDTGEGIGEVFLRPMPLYEAPLPSRVKLK